MTIVKHYKEGESLYGDISGYFTKLDVNGRLETCLVCGDADCSTFDELIMACGYDPESIMGNRIVITIEDEK